MDVKIASHRIKANGRVVLKDLMFSPSSGATQRFLSIPRSAVVGFLKNNNNEIVLNFTLDGDIDNPRFNLRENFIEKMTVALAGKLGLSVTRVGESIVVLGTKGVRQVGKGITEVGRGVEKILGR